MLANRAFERTVPRGHGAPRARRECAPAALYLARRAAAHAGVRRHMGPRCPRCRRSEFSYRSLLAVHPYRGEFSPASISCPACHARLRVTGWSRVAGAALAVVPIFVTFIFGRALLVEPWQAGVAVVIWLAFYYFGLWPITVRLKPWTPFAPWLPKSRVVGYSIYLALPVVVMVLLFILGVHFGWGM